MERIVAKRDELTSVLLGYTVNAGWRSQNDVVIIVPYDAWKSFNEQYGSLRVNVHNTNPATFMSDISLALYNELIVSSKEGKDATLIIPSSDTEAISQQDYINFVNMLSVDQLTVAYNKVSKGIRNYFRCIDPNSTVSTLLNEKKLSDWNKLVYKIALSYQLFDKPLNIVWR